MQLNYHGGHCCGLMTVYGFKYNPDSSLPPQPGLTAEAIMADHNLNRRFYRLERPAETILERFDAMLAHWHTHVNFGMLEAVLAVGRWTNQERWMDILIDRGFTLSTSSMNGNSNNRCYIFHLSKDCGPDNNPSYEVITPARITQERYDAIQASLARLAKKEQGDAS